MIVGVGDPECWDRPENDKDLYTETSGQLEKKEKQDDFDIAETANNDKTEIQIPSIINFFNINTPHVQLCQHTHKGWETDWFLSRGTFLVLWYDEKTSLGEARPVIPRIKPGSKYLPQSPSLSLSRSPSPPSVSLTYRHASISST